MVTASVLTKIIQFYLNHLALNKLHGFKLLLGITPQKLVMLVAKKQQELLVLDFIPLYQERLNLFYRGKIYKDFFCLYII